MSHQVFKYFMPLSESDRGSIRSCIFERKRRESEDETGKSIGRIDPLVRIRQGDKKGAKSFDYVECLQ